MVFNLEVRRKLEMYMKKKITVTRIAEALNISRASIYNELRNGLGEGDLAAKNFSNYSAELAQKRAEEKIVAKIR